MKKILKKLRHLLVQNSILFPYLSVAREVLDQKMQRLIDDKCTGVDAYKRVPQIAESKDSPQSSSRLCVNPCKSVLMFWYLLVLLSILYYYVEMGIMLTYGQQAWTSELQSVPMLVIDVVAIIIFVLDIVAQFNTGYISRGAIIVQRNKVMSRYLHYYFYYDVIVILILLAALISQNYYLNFAKLLVIFKFLRMLEMDELVMRKLSMSTRIKARTIYIILKQFLTIFILSHTIGIFFYMIDYSLLNTPMCLNDTSLCWLNSATAFSPIISYDWEIQYFYTVYWGVNTIANISYGDIASANQIEVIYSLLCMCFSLLVYSYITNNIIKAIIYATELRDQYRISLIQFDRYMDNLGISARAQLDTVDFLKYRHWEENSRNMQLEALMTNKLPQELKLELIQNAYQKVCNGLYYFFGQTEKIGILLQHLKQKKFSNNDIVLSQGEPLNYLHYLHSGKLKIVCNFYNSQIHLTETQMADQFMGIYQFFIHQRSQVKLLSKGNTVVYFIPREAFEMKAQNDLEFKQKLCTLWYQLKIRSNLKLVFYKCFKCGKSHHWHECNQLFPNFKAVSLENRSTLQKQSLRSKPKHHTWRDRTKLDDLINISKRSRDNILMGLSKRLSLLKKMINEKKEVLQVDCIYDWSSYLRDENLKSMKMKWNVKQSVRRLSFHKHQ